MSISIVLLAYKEEENLRVLLPEIINYVEKCGEEYEVVVVDAAQPADNTCEVCKLHNARYINQEEPGFGGAFRTAIKYAQMDKFLILDGDGSHPPKYIPEIYHKYVAEQCDVVIGSRYVKGGKTDDSKTSIWMSRILNFTFRICLGISAKDISTDYRMYDTAQLKKVELISTNYDVLQEVLLKLKLSNKKLKIGEVPIHFQKRMYGDSKRQLLKFIVSYIKTLFRLIKMRVEHVFKHAKEER